VPYYCVEIRDKKVPEAGMNTKNQTVLIAFLIAVLVAMGGAAALKGGLFIL